jgi:hypothetical protein
MLIPCFSRSFGAMEGNARSDVAMGWVHSQSGLNGGSFFFHHTTLYGATISSLLISTGLQDIN